MKTDITCMLAATFCMQDVSWETDSFSVYFGCSKEGGLISVVMVSGRLTGMHICLQVALNRSTVVLKI